MEYKPITKEAIEKMNRAAASFKVLREKRLALERPSGKITIPTGNDYETLFDQMIEVMDELHERIKILEGNV